MSGTHVSRLLNIPSLMGDETLYSWAGLVHLLNAQTDVRKTSCALYGQPASALIHDFTPNLGTVHRRFFAGSESGIEQLALRHTFLGYFLVNQPENVASAVMAATMNGPAPYLRLQLGIPASRVGASHPIKVCPQCIVEDEVMHGRAYLHLDHQLPSSLCCRKHYQPLLQEEMAQITPVHRRGWILPPLEGQKPACHTSTLTDGKIEILLRLAEYSKKWAESAPSTLTVEGLSQTYRWRLRDIGLATVGGSLRLRELLRSVRHHFAGLETLPGLSVLSSVRADWPGLVGVLARRSAKPGHPLKHLLLIEFLFGSWDQFRDVYSTARNAASPDEGIGAETSKKTRAGDRMCDFQRLVASGRSISAAAREVGITVASGVRWARVLGLKFQRRPKRLSEPVLESARVQFCSGADKTEVAVRTGISLASLNRLLSSEPEVARRWRASRFNKARSSHRKRFSEAAVQNPKPSVSQLREAMPAAYAWLYRNDKEWLHSVTRLLTPTSR